MELQNIINDFLEDCQTRGLAKNSLKTYSKQLKAFEKYMTDKSWWKSETLKTYFDEIEKIYKPTSIMVKMSILSELFEWMIVDERIVNNPIKSVLYNKYSNISLRKPRQDVTNAACSVYNNFYTKYRESQDLLHLRSFIFVGLCIFTSLSQEEIINIKSEDIRGDLNYKIKLEITMSKGEIRGFTIIDPLFLSALEEYKNKSSSNSWLFPSNRKNLDRHLNLDVMRKNITPIFINYDMTLSDIKNISNINLIKIREGS